ncbi:MAG: hypothetical protein PHV74_08925 [Dehalococcoidia bacterium]|nr:hypothetical protein [Dehalococcoidia bacterium]
MDKNELIRKLESVKVPRIELPSHRERLKEQLLSSERFRGPDRDSSMRWGRFEPAWSFLSAQPKWKPATIGALVMSLIIALSLAIPTFNGESNVALAEEIARNSEGFRIVSAGQGEIGPAQVVGNDDQVTVIFPTEKGNQIAAQVDLKNTKVLKIEIRFPGNIFNPDEKKLNPAAQEPDYIYLLAGTESVVVDGPALEGERYFFLENETVRKTADGFEVIANTHVTYSIVIDDFEDEVGLAEIHLGLEGNTVESSFIFAATPSGDGVAHNVRIVAFVDGTEIATKNAGSIEVRESRDGSLVKVPVILDGVLYTADNFNRIHVELKAKGTPLYYFVNPQDQKFYCFTSREAFEAYVREHGVTLPQQ